MLYIGIDLGGTGIKAGIVDEKGNILLKDSCPTIVANGFESVVKDMIGLAERIVANGGYTMDQIEAIGVGIPGVENPQTDLSTCVNLKWFDVPFKAEFGKYTDRKVFVGNDATVAGLAETVAGVSAGVENSVFVTLGTGVGGGVVINGKPFIGAHGVASEIGHMVTVAGGQPCNCGKKGCWECYSSATALIREARKMCEMFPNCGIAKSVEGDLSRIVAKTVIDLAREGEPSAVTIFDNYTDPLVEGLVNLVNVYDPEVIVIGGGVSNAGEILLNAVREKLPTKLLYKTMPYARIELATLGNDAGIIGAAMLGR